MKEYFNAEITMKVWEYGLLVMSSNIIGVLTSYAIIWFNSI